MLSLHLLPVSAGITSLFFRRTRVFLIKNYRISSARYPENDTAV